MAVSTRLDLRPYPRQGSFTCGAYLRKIVERSTDRRSMARQELHNGLMTCTQIFEIVFNKCTHLYIRYVREFEFEMPRSSTQDSNQPWTHMIRQWSTKAGPLESNPSCHYFCHFVVFHSQSLSGRTIVVLVVWLYCVRQQRQMCSGTQRFEKSLQIRYVTFTALLPL